MITKVKKAYVIQDSTGLLHVIDGNKFRGESGTEIWVNWATNDANADRLAVDTEHLREVLEEMGVKEFYFQKAEHNINEL